MGRVRGPRAAVVLFFLGALGLALAWAFSNPIDAAHDETANHVKAVASARGQWLGSPIAGSYTTMSGQALSAKESAGLQHMSRSFRLPASTEIPGVYGCVADGVTAATCQQKLAQQPSAVRRYGGPAQPRGSLPTWVGTYPPVIYAVEGLAGAWFGGFMTSVYAIRVAGGVFSCVLWAGAALLALDRPDRRSSRHRLLGVLAAMSPMAFFLPTTESPNGIEVAAAACFCAGLLRVTRERATTRAWAITAVAGTVFALCRQLDPIYIAVIVVCVALYRGRDAVLATVRDSRRAALTTAVAVGAAGLMTLCWDVIVIPGTGSARESLLFAENDLTDNVSQLVKELIGVFGWSRTTMPDVLYLAWLLVIGGLVVVSLRAPKNVLAAIGWAVMSVVYAEVAVAVLAEAPLGFGTDSRYVLALAVMVPLLCAETATPQRFGTAPAAAASVLLAAVQFAAVWFNLRIASVGASGPLWFPGRGWQPPGGQLVWLAVAALGAVALAASAFAAGTPPGDAAPAAPGVALPLLEAVA